MEGGKPGKEVERRRLLRGGVIALAVLVAVVAWVTTQGDDDGSTESAPASEAAPPRIVTPEELGEAAGELGQPIYWAGPMAGTELQLTELGDGAGVQVAYLPEGTEAGEGGAATLTIGSYPLEDPQEAVEGYAGRPGAESLSGRGGREVVASSESPTSVYFASPENSVQVEVYDPSPKRALTLALSGRVRPAG